MGQKTNPIGNRIGIIRGWESNWFGGRDYGDKLSEDDKIRRYVHARLAKASVSEFLLKNSEACYRNDYNCPPGIIIGKGGSEVDRLKKS